MRRASTGLALYSRTASAGSSRVISAYSTSFGFASRLLGRELRPRIRNIYALVRVADEIVDGPAEEAGLDRAARLRLLDALEAETLDALDCGYSANLVVHAFAQTARLTGIDASLIAPFFSSMRRDLDPIAAGVGSWGDAEYRAYIHGSAEVVGLMCLRVFLHGEAIGAVERARLEHGAARLGAAFQKINFLRDLADDRDRLGRSYFPGVDPDRLDEAWKGAIIAEIDADLDVARAAIARLPRSSRRATAAAAALFTEVNERLRRTPASELRSGRVSVPAPVKLRVVGGALLRPLGGRTA